MRWFFRKYGMLLRVDWAINLAYRGENLIWIAGAVIQPIVSLAVWLSIGSSGGGGGYTQRDFIQYFLGVMLVGRLTGSWDVWELEQEIREGTFSAKLLRPFHPVHWSACGNIAFKVLSLIILVPIWGVLAVFIPDARLTTGFAFIAAAAFAIVLASLIRFLIGYEIGLLSFWTTRATSIYALYEGFHMFLAGRIAPLSLFPDWIAALAKWLPFYATVGFPVDLLVGKLEGRQDEILQGFTTQIVWSLLLFFAFRIVWRRGIRRYGAVGG